MSLYFEPNIEAIFTAYKTLCLKFNIKNTIEDGFVTVKTQGDDIFSILYPHIISSTLYYQQIPYVYVLKKPSLLEANLIENAIIKSVACYISDAFYSSDVKEICKQENIDYLYRLSYNYIDSYINEMTFHSLNLLNDLSKEFYEHRECRGTISFFLKEPNNYQIVIESKPNNMRFISNNKKLIRKLLETTSDSLSLAVHLDSTLNVPIFNGYVNIENCNILVKFLGPNNWELYDHEELVVKRSKGNYIHFESSYFNTQKKNQIKEYIKKVNAKFTLDDIDKFILMLKKNCGSHFHGALIIFTDDETFAKKMSSFSRAITVKNRFKIQDISNNYQFFNQLSIVDGALVFNTEGELLTFSTILDGCVLTEGDSSRGSRFNSSKTFTEYYNNKEGKNYFAISLSEDGDINVFDGQINNTD